VGPSGSNMTTSVADQEMLDFDLNLSAQKLDRSATNNGALKLTPKGRMQILNRLSKGPFTENDTLLSRNKQFASSCPPDLLPAGEFEVSFLVTVWLAVSRIINEKYGPDLTRTYFGAGLFGDVAKMVLHPPANVKVSSMGGHHQGQMKNYDARLPLRFFAGYKFLTLYTLSTLFLWLIFRVDPMLFLFCSGFFTAILLLLILFF